MFNHKSYGNPFICSKDSHKLFWSLILAQPVCFRLCRQKHRWDEINNLQYLERKTRKYQLFFMQALYPVQIGIKRCCFCGGRNTGEKHSEQGEDQQQTQPTVISTKLESTHTIWWWEVSALTTTPSLLIFLFLYMSVNYECSKKCSYPVHKNTPCCSKNCWTCTNYIKTSKVAYSCVWQV